MRTSRKVCLSDPTLLHWGMTKPCICCRKELPVEAYYRHPRMADGHLNKCKECVKAYVSAYAAAKAATPEGREAERQRGREKYHRLYKPEVRDPRRIPAKTSEEKRARRRAALRRYMERANKDGKTRARSAVAWAVRNCKLVRLPCERCGKQKSEAHHPDYSKPLEVIWLCRQCHAKEHRKKD